MLFIRKQRLINSILTSNYSSIEDRDQLFLAYSTTNQINEAYYDKTETDYLLTNKVSTTGDATISGNLDVGSVTIDAGSYTMGKISVGDTTAYESFNGNVNGFNLNPQTQMSFVACSTNTGPTVNHIGLCCLNRASTYSSYTPAITFSAWGQYYGAELNHIGAIACQQKQIQSQRHLEGDIVFFYQRFN